MSNPVRWGEGGGSVQPQRTSSNQGVCHNCGEIIAAHDRKRRYDGGGPPGSYYYVYLCPDGSGRLET